MRRCHKIELNMRHFIHRFPKSPFKPVNHKAQSASYHIQGGYYAYMENVQRLGYSQVISIIEEIQNTLDVMKS